MKATESLAGRRVLFVLSTLNFGGAERQAVLLARHLRDNHDARVELWGLSGGHQLPEVCDEYGLPWKLRRCSTPELHPRRLASLVRFTWWLRRAQPEVLLPYTHVPNFVCGLTWRPAGARLCVWNQRDEGRLLTGSQVQRLAIQLSPWIVSNSAHATGILVDLLGAPRERIRVVPNGVQLAPPQRARAEWRAELGVAPDTPLACMIATLHQHKDHATLLKAWRLVLKQWAGGPEPVLLLAGRFYNTHGDLLRLAERLGLGERVRFLGAVKDVSGLLAASDLGVFSSCFEGMPNGVLESMAAGLPMVATDIPGIREALGDSQGEQLVPIREPVPLARRIGALLSDSQARQRLGAVNRARAETEFAPARMCEAMAGLVLEGLRG